LLIRTRFFLLIVFCALLWIFIGFLIYSNLDRINRLQSYRIVTESLPGKISEIQNAVYSVIYDEKQSMAFYENGRSAGLASFNDSYIDLYNQLKLI